MMSYLWSKLARKVKLVMITRPASFLWSYNLSPNVSARNKCLCSKLATRKWSRTVPGSVKAKQNGWLPKICPSYWILKLPMWWIDLGTTLRTWSTLCDMTPISSLMRSLVDDLTSQTMHNKAILTRHFMKRLQFYTCVKCIHIESNLSLELACIHFNWVRRWGVTRYSILHKSNNY